MKCPHCHEAISQFSRAVNRAGVFKVCPHCHRNMRLYVDWKVAAVLIIPILATTWFLQRWLRGYGVPDVFAVIFMSLLGTMLARRLRA